MTLDEHIRGIVREEIQIALTSISLTEPDLISLEEARRICDNLGKDAILELVHSADETGFPAVVLGRRTIKVDRTRLIPWLHAGGLRNKTK